MGQRDSDVPPMAGQKASSTRFSSCVQIIRIIRMKKAEAVERAVELLRRVAIARALAMNPAVMLMSRPRPWIRR